VERIWVPSVLLWVTQTGNGYRVWVLIVGDSLRAWFMVSLDAGEINASVEAI
jgi:hypothetical protein